MGTPTSLENLEALQTHVARRGRYLEQARAAAELSARARAGAVLVFLDLDGKVRLKRAGDGGHLDRRVDARGHAHVDVAARRGEAHVAFAVHARQLDLNVAARAARVDAARRVPDLDRAARRSGAYLAAHARERNVAARGAQLDPARHVLGRQVAARRAYL